jgi:O-antigen ligase
VTTDRTREPGLSWTIALIWLLGFGAVFYLGMKGGGYDPLVHDQIGIVAWWLVLALVLVGALPRRRPGPLALCALGVFGAFVAWTALSLTWTESSERTLADLARIGGYAGFFALAVLSREAGGARPMVAAVGSAIGLLALIALASRLQPGWFPDVGVQTANFLPGAQERLSYPINYWNGLAGLIAIGLPLLLQMATDARTIVVRALAAAALPAVILAIYFTLSRGGIGSAVIAVAVYFAFTSDRLPKLAIAIVTGAGGGLLVILAHARFSLVHGLDDAAARTQGDEMLWITIVVCVFVGLVVALLSEAGARAERPEWTRVPKRTALWALGAAALVLIVAGIAVNAPQRGSDAWDEFKGSTKAVGGADRLGSVAGENRYAIWASAVREMKSEPLTGTGAGTFEYWWNRDATVNETVIDAHSLYLQTLGETGIVGFLLIAGFFVLILVAGGTVAVRAGPERRPALAAAIAGFLALVVSASVDWVWQLPVNVVAAMLLAAVLVTARDRHPDGARSALPIVPRVGVVAVAAVAIVVIAIPLASTSLIRQSQDEAIDGDSAAALADARTATNVAPFAATPRMQQALLLEEAGDLEAAAAEATAATERESTNWRTWVLLSRIEAKRGNAAASVAAYREAKALNPTSDLFRDAE